MGRGVAFNALDSILAFATGTISGILVPRLLGPHWMGVYSLVLGWIGIVSLLGAVGLPQTCLKFIAELKGKKDETGLIAFLNWILTLQVAAALLAWVLFWPCANWLCTAAKLPHLTGLVRLAGLAVVFEGLCGCLLLAVRGVQRFDLLALSTTIAAPVNMAVIVAGAWLGNISALLMAILFASMAKCGIGIVIARQAMGREFAFTPRPRLNDRSLERRAWAFAPLAWVGLATGMIVTQRSEIFILGVCRPTAEVAYYATAFGISATSIRMLPGIITSTLLPYLSEAVGASQPRRVADIYALALWGTLWVMAPVAAFVAAFAGPLLTALLGPAYRPATEPLRWLMVSACFAAALGPSTSVLTALDRQKQVVLAGLGAALVNITLDLVLIPRWGPLGAAIGTTIGIAVNMAASLCLGCRASGITVPWRNLVRIGVGASLAYLAARQVLDLDPRTPVLLGSLLVASIYILLSRAMGMMPIQNARRITAAAQSLPVPLRRVMQFTCWACVAEQ